MNRDHWQIHNMWKAFHNNQTDIHYPGSPCSNLDGTATKQTTKRKLNFFSSLWLPRVYAKEKANEEATVQKKTHTKEKLTSETVGETTSEKLLQHRPDVVVTDQDVQEYLAKETGMDRLRDMFSTDHKGHMSREISGILEVSKMTGMIMFFIASYHGSRNAKDEFIKSHLHVKYQTKFTAQRRYRDFVFKEGLKGGGKWALKTIAFTGIFLLLAFGITNVIEAVSLSVPKAGGVTGFILRLNLGLRGALSAAIITAFLGTVAGLVMLGGTKLMGGALQDQVHYDHIMEILREKKEIELLSKEVAS